MTKDGYAVTNAAGNLVDLNGNQINGDFLTTPGFPGFGEINASQTLAYAADMLESGVPVVDAYISDVHGNEFIKGLTAAGQPCFHAPSALGSGSACYLAQAAYYNQAFGTFFQRLAADGITPQNTLFVLSPDEGDHEAGANVGRAIQPTPAGCDGVTVPCTYPAGTFGELEGNVTGLLNAGDRRHHPVRHGVRHGARVLRQRRPVGSPRRRSGRSTTTSRHSPPTTPMPEPPRRSPTTSPTRRKRRSCTWSTPTRRAPRRSPSSPSPTTT